MSKKDKEKVVQLSERVPELKKKRQQKINRRLIGYVSFFFILILGILYFQSSLSNISKIEVMNTGYIPKEYILKSVDISTKDNFWKVDTKKLSEKLTALPEIKKATVERKFPQVIVIHVEEYRKVAYLLDEGKFRSILENGQMLTEDEKSQVDAPILVGWSEGETIQEMVSQLFDIPPAIENAISEVHYTPTDLDPQHITVYMTDGHEISATMSEFAKKMSYYSKIVAQLDPSVKGILHLEVAAYFKPFSSSEQQQIKIEE